MTYQRRPGKYGRCQIATIPTNLNFVMDAAFRKCRQSEGDSKEKRAHPGGNNVWRPVRRRAV
jgi:hypothetical protein